MTPKSQNNAKIDSITQKVTTNGFITEIAALRPLPGSSCAQIAFSGRKALREVLQPDNNGQLPESRLSETCGLSFSINNGKSERFTALHIEVVSGYHLKPDNRPLYLGGNVKFSGKQTWQIRLPRQLDEHYAYKVTTLSSNAPVGGFISKLPKIGATRPHTALPESVAHSTLYHKVTH